MIYDKLKIVLATTNEGKIAEYDSLLAPLGMKILSLADFPDYIEPEENGRDFAENALIKARAACAASGMPALADDSGLCVDALGGAPGVHSARYGADWQFLQGESRDARNIRKLLHAMQGQNNRSCHFTCAIAAARPDGGVLVREGHWHGRILTAPRGGNGFGYDPVFYDPALAKTAAELDKAAKNSISHRGNALRAILAAWRAFISR